MDGNPNRHEFRRTRVSGSANVQQGDKYIHYNIEQAILLPSDESHTFQGRVRNVEGNGSYRVRQEWNALASHAALDHYGRKDNLIQSTAAVDHHSLQQSLRGVRTSQDPIKTAEEILAVTRTIDEYMGLAELAQKFLRSHSILEASDVYNLCFELSIRNDTISSSSRGSSGYGNEQVNVEPCLLHKFSLTVSGGTRTFQSTTKVGLTVA